MEMPPSWCIFLVSLAEKMRYTYEVIRTSSRLDIAAKETGDRIQLQGELCSNLANPEYAVEFGMAGVHNYITHKLSNLIRGLEARRDTDAGVRY